MVNLGLFPFSYLKKIVLDPGKDHSGYLIDIANCRFRELVTIKRKNNNKSGIR